jgi:VanZ family protein
MINFKHLNRKYELSKKYILMSLMFFSVMFLCYIMEINGIKSYIPFKEFVITTLVIFLLGAIIGTIICYFDDKINSK